MHPGCADTLSDTIDLKCRMACQNLEVAVTVKQGQSGAGCQRSDETVDQLANGLSPAPAQPMNCDSLFIIHRPRRNRRGPCEQTPKIKQPGPRPERPYERRHRPRSSPPEAPRHDHRRANRCRGETRSMRTYQSQSRCAVSTHPFEIALPATSAQAAGLVQTKWLRRHCAQREIDGIALCLQTIAAHDLPAGFFIDVHVGARHVPRVSIIERQATSTCLRRNAGTTRR